MSTSGTQSFNLVTNQIITEAFQILGICSEGEPVTADMYARGLVSLNLLIKTFGASDHLWTRTERTLSLTTGTASYDLSPKPMRILSVRQRTSGVDTPLTAMAREEYFDQPNKAAATTAPQGYYYDPQTTTGTLYVWPTPNITVAGATSLQLTYLRRMDDFDTSSDDADIPQEWLQTLAYALAVELGLKYGAPPDVRAEVATRSKALLDGMKAFDSEPDSVFIQVPVIAEAFELIGASPVTAEMYVRAKRSLDYLLSAWSAQNHLWTRTEGTITPVAGQAAYVLSPKAQRVLSVRRRATSGGIDTPLTELSRSDYFDMPNKSAQSIPVNFYYDPQATTGTVYLWPAPSAQTAAGYTFPYTYLRTMAAFDGTTLDMPAEWSEAVAYNLAARLKTKYPMKDKNADAHIDAMAAKFYADLKGWDTEPTSLFLMPDRDFEYGRY